VKKRFNEAMRDAFPRWCPAEFDHFLGLDDPTVNLVGIVKVTGNIGTATGKRFFLPGLFLSPAPSTPLSPRTSAPLPSMSTTQEHTG
jgi:hypothetical protein